MGKKKATIKIGEKFSSVVNIKIHTDEGETWDKISGEVFDVEEDKIFMESGNTLCWISKLDFLIHNSA